MATLKNLDPALTKDLKKIEPPITEGIIGVGVECFSASEKAAELKRSGKNEQLRKMKSDDCRIAKIMDSKPASKDGRLRVGDKILEVNGRKIKNISLEEVVKLIGGEPGSYVTILVEGNPVPITIQRVSKSI